MSEFEFERGREAGVKWGERFEQERIVKILEEERKRHKEEGLLTAAVYLKDLIALIKGENK
jgi:predicted nucleic acid-binding Zn ribbon protein